YFAAMESDGGAAPSFFDGETSSINTTHGKFLTYPPAHTIQASYLATSPGTITLTVPVADVGGNSTATLYSITGLTVTQGTASSIATRSSTKSRRLDHSISRRDEPPPQMSEGRYQPAKSSVFGVPKSARAELTERHCGGPDNNPAPRHRLAQRWRYLQLYLPVGAYSI